jgi:uncharacterized protein
MEGLRRARLTMILPLLAVLFAFQPVRSRAQAVASLPQPTDYVSDFAHVLSPDAITRLDSICEQLDHSQANAKIAVVTVQSLDGDDAADYANQLEDHWKMGDKGDNKYAMVLLAVADHKYRIEVGYGLEGILPDGKTGDIGRDMVPDLKAGDYDGAMTVAVGEVAQVIADDAQITLDNQRRARGPAKPTGTVASRHPGRARSFFLFLYWCSSAGLAFGSVGSEPLFWADGRGGWGGGFGGGFGGGSFGGGGGGGGSVDSAAAAVVLAAAAPEEAGKS